MKTIHPFSLMSTVLATLLSIAVKTNAQTLKFELEPVITTNLAGPIQVVHAGDGSQRLFVVEKTGSIKVFDRVNDNTFTYRGEFFSTTDLLTNGEQGLLSLAFDPNFSTTRQFFVYHNNQEGDLVVKRYLTDPDDSYRYDPTSEDTLMIIPHPTNNNHNGGELHFGPDGFLYLSTGDGGSSGDPSNNAQNTASYLGKILRFQVDGTFPDDNLLPNSPVYALGLRNPFRWSFDRLTQDVWIGDVGQNSNEEINVIPFANLRGANFGWKCYEGNDPFALTGACPDVEELVFPIHTYPTGNVVNRSVIGGVVYRGTTFPSIYGYYFGADYYNSFLHLIHHNGDTYEFDSVDVGITGISDIGESENGELYAVSLSENAVYRITVEEVPLPVNFSHFNASISEGKSVQLTWGTTNSENFEDFLIEKSQNGREFHHLDIIPRKDLFGEPQEYTYTDFDISPGQTYYYRLKIINSDHSHQYSNIVSVEVNTTHPIVIEERQRLIQANPADGGELKVHLSEKFHHLEIMSSTGEKIRHFDLKGITGLQQLSIGQLPAGLYLARFVGDKKIVTEKVIFP